jgi:hypothetical protein
VEFEKFALVILEISSIVCILVLHCCSWSINGAPFTNKMEKLSVPALKERLKDAGMVQTGDKGTLIFRLKLLEKCKEAQLIITDDEGMVS